MTEIRCKCIIEIDTVRSHIFLTALLHHLKTLLKMKRKRTCKAILNESRPKPNYVGEHFLIKMG